MNSAEIAKLAGVSRSTVSRVINNYPNVPEATRQKVQKVIEEYDYVPHASARMLAGSQNRVIGLFIVDVNKAEPEQKNRMTKSPYYLEFTSSVIEVASELDYTVLVHIIHNIAGYEKVKAYFFNKTIAGGIFIGQSDNDPAIQRIIDKGYQVVLVDQSISTHDKSVAQGMIVNADNQQGAYQATKYLLAKQHTRIVHLTGGTSKYSAKARLAGYQQAMHEAQIPIRPEWIVASEFVEASGYLATKQLFQQQVVFTAIFASNDKIAFGAMKAIQEQGLRVPEDISVIGFDNIESAKYSHPPLTSINMELGKMAELATQALVQAIEAGYIVKNSVVPVTLVERTSCGVAPTV